MSLWNPLRIESVLKDKLIDELGQINGEERYSSYVEARRILLEQLLEEIKANQPSLSDHGPSHIADVLQKSYELLGNEIDQLTAIELYTLCVSILFHDVGNFHDRKRHNIRIAEIYDLVRKKEPHFATERSAVLAIAGAHTGFCAKGSRNTLKSLQTFGVFGSPVRFQPIAALLRFADELAEGPQRTSLMMQHFDKYEEESKIFHQLANVTAYTVDKANARIQINYSIYIEIDDEGKLFYEKVPLLELLGKITERISKLNEERVYCRYYCNWLEKYKEVSVNFQFIHEHEYVELGLEPLVLNDLIVPGEQTANLSDPNYSASSLHQRLMAAIFDKV